ncbi:MAG: hypothetical protein KA436_11175 [Oligoflexales bacterium]|nr:hypothetical protein [Oligoflexales bacterium]
MFGQGLTQSFGNSFYQIIRFVFCLFLSCSLVACSGNEKNKSSPRETPNENSSGLSLNIPGGGRPLSAVSANKSFNVKLVWLSAPVVGKACEIKLSFYKGEGTENASKVQITEFKPWMVEHGHGLQEELKLDAIHPDLSEKNVFTVNGMIFSMKGGWEIRFTATVDGQSASIAIPIEI